MHNSSRVGPAIVSREEQQAFIPIYIRRDRWSRSDPNRFGPPDRQQSWLLQKDRSVRLSTIRPHPPCIV
jgi:hypothetical protein